MNALKSLIKNWNAGKLPILAAQWESASHGLNLQKGPGRDVIFYGLPETSRTYWQSVKRIHRQGVGSTVRVHRVMAKNTVDEAVLERVKDREATQDRLFVALKEYRKKVTQ